jgi:L-ascorbate metabolism protein UlaG (beta-lactamase superfamily)
MSFFTSRKPGVRFARWSLYLSTGLGLGAVLIPLFLGACVFSAPGYNGPVSDHFDGERFRNLEPFAEKSFGDVMKWRWTSSKTPWPDKRGLPPGPPPPRRVEGEELRVTFVNHATVLIQTAGLNILTDPVWSERASPVSWAGPKRQKDAGILYEDLPPIDLVVISHNHYDHLDIATLKKLSADHAPLILVPLGNAALLQANGIANARDLDWWESVDVAPGVRATFTRCQHWSARGTRDRFKTLWGGFAFETPGGLVYYSGDTGFGAFYAEVREKFGRPRLALLPIGAYEPRWFMKWAHQNPEEAVQAHNILQPLASLGVHWGTWQLTDEGMDDPVVTLDAALEDAGLTREDFWVLDNGESRDVPAMK